MRRENEQEKKQNGYCEQDMVDQIARLSENTEVPDSLRPENIDRLLKGKKQKKHFHSYRIGLAAACVAVVTGIIVWQYGSLHHGMIDSKGVSADNAERKISGSRKIRIANGRKVTKELQCMQEVEMRHRQQRIQAVGMRHQRQQWTQMAGIRRPMSGSPV